MDTITVIKNDHAGREVLRYTGRVVARDGRPGSRSKRALTSLTGKAPTHTFRRGDRFVEWHYSDRWYNIFEMHDRGR